MSVKFLFGAKGILALAAPWTRHHVLGRRRTKAEVFPLKREFGQLLSMLGDGANIEISAEDWDFGHLLTLVDEAVEGGGTLYISNTDELSTGQLEILAEDGRGT